MRTSVRAFGRMRACACTCMWACTATRTRLNARSSVDPPLPHLHRVWAHRCHICAGSWLTQAFEDVIVSSIRVYTVSNGEFDGLHDGIVLTGGCALNVKVLGRSGWAVHNYDNNHNTDDVQEHTTATSSSHARPPSTAPCACFGTPRAALTARGSPACFRAVAHSTEFGLARRPAVYVCIEMTALRAS